MISQNSMHYTAILCLNIPSADASYCWHYSALPKIIPQVSQSLPANSMNSWWHSTALPISHFPPSADNNFPKKTQNFFICHRSFYRLIPNKARNLEAMQEGWEFPSGKHLAAEPEDWVYCLQRNITEIRQTSVLRRMLDETAGSV